MRGGQAQDSQAGPLQQSLKLKGGKSTLVVVVIKPKKYPSYHHFLHSPLSSTPSLLSLAPTGHHLLLPLSLPLFHGDADEPAMLLELMDAGSLDRVLRHCNVLKFEFSKIFWVD